MVDNIDWNNAADAEIDAEAAAQVEAAQVEAAQVQAVQVEAAQVEAAQGADAGDAADAVAVPVEVAPNETQKRNAEYWENKELDLLIALRLGITDEDVINDCSVQPTQPMPVAGTLAKLDQKLYIRTNSDESKPVSFADHVQQPNQKVDLFIVKKVKQIDDHLFEVEPNDEIDVEEGSEYDVLMNPFLLPLPPSAECKKKTPGLYLEERQNFTRDGLVRTMQYLDPEGTLPLTNPQEVTTVYKALFAGSAPGADCPNPLVNGECVDVNLAQDAGPDSDIRNGKLYTQDAQKMQLELETLLQNKSVAKAFSKMFMIGKSDYDDMILENTMLWQRYNKQNREVAAMAHLLLRKLVVHYTDAIERLNVSVTENIQRAALVWLAFYVNLPVFFFRASIEMSSLMKQNKKTLEFELMGIMQRFHRALGENLTTFLPPSTVYSQLRQLIYSFLQQLGKMLNQFRYLPKALQLKIK